MVDKITSINSKVVVFGDFGVGKTSLLGRFLKNEFGVCSSTVGASYNSWKSTPYTLNKKTVQNVIGFWDTAGQERFESLLPIYLRQADIVIFCWDSSKRLTNVDLIRRLNMVKSVNSTAKWFVVFTKTDLSDNIRDIEAEFLIEKELETSIYYTSSKNDIGITKLFNDIIKYIQTETRNDSNGINSNGINSNGINQQSVIIEPQNNNTLTSKLSACLGFL